MTLQFLPNDTDPILGPVYFLYHQRLSDFVDKGHCRVWIGVYSLYTIRVTERYGLITLQNMETDPMQSSSSKSILLIVVAFLVGGIVGVAADPYLPASLSNAKKSYSDGFSAARKIVEESRYGNYFRSPDDVRLLSGIVTAVNDTRITLRLSSDNPFDDQTLNERVVLITPDTKILKLVVKDSKAFQTELAEFNKTPQAISAPQPFTQVAITPQDLKTGELVTVTTSENVKTMKEFSATEVRVELNMMSK